jgi:hypothetical protein
VGKWVRPVARVIWPGPDVAPPTLGNVAAFSGVSMEPGILYGALSRLERRGWVTPLATAERRRPYPAWGWAALRRRPDDEPARFRGHLLITDTAVRGPSLRMALLVAVYFEPRFVSPY